MGQYRKQSKNVNRHTDQGTRLLEESIARDGFISAVTVAADGEAFDGSNRIQVGGDKFADAIEVHTDGLKPVVVVRDDIPSADDPKAKRLAVLANQITASDWNPDAALLSELARSDDVIRDITQADAKLRELLRKENGTAEKVDAGELIDKAAQLQEKWQCKAGDIWTTNGHFWICGDCREPETWKRLFEAATVEKVNGVFTSPPYAEQRKKQYGGIPTEQYVEWWGEVQARVREHLAADGSFFVNIKPHCENGERVLYVFDLVTAMRRKWEWRFVDELCWRKAKDGYPGGYTNRFRDAFEPVYHFALNGKIKFMKWNVAHESESAFKYSRGNASQNSTGSGFGLNGRGLETQRGLALPSNVIEISEVNPGDAEAQAAQFPVALPDFFIRAYSDPGDVWLDNFAGSGTTIVAAHQNERRGLGIEKLEKYCAVICERMLNLGLMPQRIPLAGI